MLEETEQRLRVEIEELKRQLEEQKRLLELAGARDAPAHPSRGTLRTLTLLFLILIVAAFFAGYIPRHRRESILAAEAGAEAQAIPVVNVVPVAQAPTEAAIVLPGNIQSMTEAPVLARASGYIKRRYVDIGDRVRAGQLLADIEAPELDQQVRQANAVLDQTNAALQQAQANLQQGISNENLARVTAQRWKNLATKGVVSRQENDTYQAQYLAQQANVEALRKAVSAAHSNISAAQANLARLTELQGYQKVRAPFAGVITVRNVDVGALVNEGNTLLFRIAQNGRLRTYVNVPQSDAEAIKVGQTATVTVPDLPGRQFHGTVTRTSNALDPTSRTLLTEIQLPDEGGALLPGMYAQVVLSARRPARSLLIPGDTLVIRSDGPQVAVVGADHLVRFQRIRLGRDYGDQIEVLSGLQPGWQIVVNPGDTAHEGAKVNPVPLTERRGPARTTAAGSK